MIMSATVQLVQHQHQKLRMTQQMQQSIEILRCDRDELETYIHEMSLENPLLEYDSSMSEKRFYETSEATRSVGKGGNSPTIDQWLTTETTRVTQIEDQIRVMDADSPVKQIALFLAGMLDEQGYLRDAVPKLAALLRCTPTQIEQGIELLHEVEPFGVGAHDLQTCLLLQVRLLKPQIQGLVRYLITHHLEDIAVGRFADIAQSMNSSPQEIQDGIAAIKRLDPRPGMRLEKPSVSYVRPEVVVRHVGGQYVVAHCDDIGLRLSINEQYVRLMKTTDDPTVRDFLHRKLKLIHWTRSCLAYRQSTLQCIAEAIVRKQKDYFERGNSGLKPLTLRHLSEQLKMHESTISRAVRGAYMETPGGVLPFKFFFSSVLNGDVSATSAKQQMKVVLQSENPEAPYSDAELVRMMADSGIVLSRRTVAKYRDQMNIPSSTRRRQRGPIVRAY